MANKYLTLIRHAKSSWQTQGLSDHDRPLNTRGLSDAPAIAKHLSEKGCVPDLLLCSTANRAQQSASYLIDEFGLKSSQITIIPELYLASPGTILDIVGRLASSATHVMVVAHNPGLEELSAVLAHRDVVPMPTMAVHHFSCSTLSATLPAPDPAETTPPSEKTANDQAMSTELIFELFPKMLH